MENKPTNIEELFQKLKEYADVRLNLFKLQGISKVSGLLSSAISFILIGVIFITFIVCLTIGLSLWIGDSLGKTYYGFFIVAGFYVIIGLILFLARGKILKAPISNKLIKELFN